MNERTVELQESHRQLRQLALQLTRTERLQRGRTAGELHDNVGQLLAFAQ